MATEILEHCAEPELVLSEIHRVLKPDGRLFVTVPFIWNLHEIPNDEYRYTPYSLKRHLENAGFRDVVIKPLGGWNMALAQMLGLWLGFAPLPRFSRRLFRMLLFPVFYCLVKTDRKFSEFDGARGSMFPGLQPPRQVADRETMAKILFIGHDAELRGAPIVLLHLLRWLCQNHPEIKIDVLLLRGGQLTDEYRGLANVVVADHSSTLNLVRRTFRKLQGKSTEWYMPLHFGNGAFRRRYDAVLGNTILSLPSLRHFKKRGVPTICWMHEMEYVVSTIFSPDEFSELARSVDRFIVPSKPVEAALRKFNVSTPVTVIHEISQPLSSTGIDTAEVKDELGFPLDSFIIAGGGTPEWRKGTDLFLQIARRVRAKHSNIRFVWIGGGESAEYSKVLFDLGHARLESHVKFTGITTEPARYIAACDVFALTSREDPCPLICLEAASLAKPIICFEKSGGIVDFVGADAGSVIPYLDVDAFGDKIIEYERDRERLARAGAAAKAKAATDYSSESATRDMTDVLLSILK